MHLAYAAHPVVTFVLPNFVILNLVFNAEVSNKLSFQLIF